MQQPINSSSSRVPNRPFEMWWQLVRNKIESLSTSPCREQIDGNRTQMVGSTCLPTSSSNMMVEAPASCLDPVAMQWIPLWTSQASDLAQPPTWRQAEWKSRWAETPSTSWATWKRSRRRTWTWRSTTSIILAWYRRRARGTCSGARRQTEGHPAN